ncbi:acyltransferase family protein [Mucilaginibacter sp. E4BP6]|uniref:acyltransferase family protein n=1 Tax=Mucilaginibacter sp. E4BP6 TaxID=2723089 RepID=UPI0015C8CB66|nr:acyltransferase [Mucilaginibacter sp. E4BP6]NYE67988.1 peptidoglycan/LPS O-acetylase OafA/YrhL [Mucilaginibacter sp. E4BP6]
MFKQLGNIKTKLFAEIISIPEILQPSHLPGLDGLRGISIIIVVLGHLIWADNLKFFIGYFGVNIFFVISGFLITTLLLKEKVKTGAVSLKNFYLRRVLKIMPVAYLYLFTLVILNAIFKLNITNGSFTTAALYLKNIPFKNSEDWYTGHFWSLSIEEQFYLIFPALLVLYKNKYVFIVISIILLIKISEFVAFNSSITESNKLLHYVVFGIVDIFGNGTIEILIGSLTSLLLFKQIIKFDRIKIDYWISCIFLVGAFLLDTFFYNNVLSSIVFSVCISFVILNNLYQVNFLGKLLNNKIIVKIGLLSYSIYIWQQLFLKNQPWAHSFKYSNSIILNLIGLSIVAYLSYYLFEKYFLKLKNKIVT